MLPTGIVTCKTIFSHLSSIIIKNAAIAIGITFLIISIQIDRAHGNSSLHELIGVLLLSVNASILNKRHASLFEILISAGSGALCFHLGDYLQNGSMLQLGGVVILLIAATNFFQTLKNN